MTFKTKLLKIIEEPHALRGLKKSNNFHSFLSCCRYLEGELNTFIDIGANVGEYVDACSKFHPKAKIYAFEPDPNAYSKLIKKRNKNIKNFPNALWDKNEKGIFYLDDTRQGLNSSIKNKTRCSVEMNFQRFDNLKINIKGNCFCKIDAEGAEIEIIRGFGEKLKQVDVLMVEVTKPTDLPSLFELTKDFFFFKQIGLREHSIPEGEGKCDLIFWREGK